MADSSFQARTDIRCEVRLPRKELFAQNISTALFRILQETLTNVARHAKATRVEIVNQKQRDQLVLRIRDNGLGFDPEDSSISRSTGLMGMQGNAAMLGGGVNIASAPGKGTTVTAWIPLRSAEEAGAESVGTS